MSEIQSKEVGLEGLRGQALKNMMGAMRLERDRWLKEQVREQVITDMEKAEGAALATLVKQYETLTAEMDTLEEQAKDADGKAAEWRQVAGDLEENLAS